MHSNPIMHYAKLHHVLQQEKTASSLNFDSNMILIIIDLFIALIKAKEVSVSMVINVLCILQPPRYHNVHKIHTCKHKRFCEDNNYCVFIKTKLKLILVRRAVNVQNNCNFLAEICCFE